MADTKELETKKSTLVGGPRAVQAMCMAFAQKMEQHGKVARFMSQQDSALAFDCAFAAVAIVPYILEKGLEKVFMARLGKLTMELVEEFVPEDAVVGPEKERFLEVLDKASEGKMDDEGEIFH